MNDKDLIKGCLENDRDSQKALYDRFYGKMFGLCLRYSSGEDEAHEMLQEGFLLIYKNLKNFKENEPFDLWFKKMMIDACIKHIRNDKRKKLIVSTVYANKGIIKDKSINLNDNAIVAKIKIDTVLKAVHELSSGFRIVFNLFLIDGYTYKEISEMLDISEDTAKSNLEKTMFTFRKNLTEHLNDSDGK